MAIRPPKINRRRFLAAAAATAAGMVGYARVVEPHWARVIRLPLPVAGLPDALADKTLVQISDLHVGRTDFDYLRSWVRSVGDLAPDVIVVTGDFVHTGAADEIAAAAELLWELPPVPLGVFGVLGNHDYGPGWRNRAVGDRVAEHLAGVGVRVLRNEAVGVGGLTLFGVDDLWSGRFDLARTLAGAAGPSVGLCHNPDGLDQPGWGGFQGWVLSGHTHGGQCRAPFFDPSVLPVSNPRYAAGHVDLGDGRHVYVNRGIGYGRRVRFNVRPEVTAFTLMPA
jgi:predicted MPP superfamily phosphohydrolase